MQVRRVFVEKKPGYDIEAQHLAADIRTNLSIPLERVRIFNRYDVQGLNEEEFTAAVRTVLSEPNVDTVYTQLPVMASAFVFGAEYLPGQYDQRADSAAQCIQLLTQKDAPMVRCAKFYAIEGNITPEQQKRIRGYLINPVDSGIAQESLPETLDIALDAPQEVPVLEGFTQKDQSAIAELHSSMGLAMSVEDLAFVRDYFASEQRDPTITEVRVIDTYWSDHCRHTTFLTRIEEIQIADSPYLSHIRAAHALYLERRAELYVGKNKDICLMDMATLGMKSLRRMGLLDDLDESDEINACSIFVDVDVDGKLEKWLIQFKNETHNHPTEIEPFGGAATCLGGAIRDPLSGRAYVYQAMRVTGAADPTVSVENTLANKLPQRKLTTGAAAGFSSYGNQIGLATGMVTEIYDEGYMAKRMEIGAVIGAAPADNVVRAKPLEGDIIVLLGGRTGRDGCGGATGSSKAHTEESLHTCGAEVQKGNAPTERKLQRLFRNSACSRLIKKCNDFGAGGVCVAIGELSDGLDISLDAVPKKYDGLDGTELAISESQERMAVVLSPGDVDAFLALAAQENLEATPVAVVRETGRMRMTWKGKQIVDIARSFLDTNGVTQVANASINAPTAGGWYQPSAPAEGKIIDTLFKTLSDLNVCSQKGLTERFDATIGRGSVFMPFGGKTQLTPSVCMAAKPPVMNGFTDTATVMAYGYCAPISRWSPFHGAVYSVVESLCKLACSGTDISRARLTLQEYFERLHKVPERWGKPVAAMLGALYAQLKLGIPAIGGKDSMSGSYLDMDVPPTVVCFAVGVGKASQLCSPELKAAGHTVRLLRPKLDVSLMPDLDEIKAQYIALAQEIQAGKIVAAQPIGIGGVAAAAAKMSLGNEIGIKLNMDASELFSPLIGAVLIECVEDSVSIETTVLGKTIEDKVITLNSETVTIADATKTWLGKLDGVFQTWAENKGAAPVIEYKNRQKHKPKTSIARPRVFIPVFPGTNCEYDTVRAFEQAGAVGEVVVVRNLTSADVEQTAEVFARTIRNSQIIMIPGGFSGGDEPEGSGKFIATMFRNPRVREEVTALLEQRDGLVLGICNGFQALIKLGLVPFGKIVDIDETCPTLTFNTIGRHVSCIVDTRVASVQSPWLAKCEVGEEYSVAVSHGEGRFVASDEMLGKLQSSGQIATQYVGPSGPTMDGRYNPNGSVWAVEGITSPDGRVFGKMGHLERYAQGLFRNVPGNYDMKVFESGVEYFK